MDVMRPIKRFKLVENDDDGYTLYLYIESIFEEFSSELNNVKIDADELNGNLKKYVKRNFKDVKVTTVKVVAGSMIVASIAMGPKGVSSRAFAEPMSISTYVVPDFTYKVQPGDNLTTVYLKTGVRAEKLKKLNNLSDEELQEGQVLRLI